jgi:hypothetical protein
LAVVYVYYETGVAEKDYGFGAFVGEVEEVCGCSVRTG